MMRLVATVLLLFLPLAAQKMPLPDGSERVVALVDVGELLDTDGDRLVDRADKLSRILAFVRAFTEPALTRAADLQMLGDHHLVVLGTRVQAAGVEQLVAEARKARRKQFQLDLEICSIPAALFEKDVRKFVAPPAAEAGQEEAPRVAVLSPEAAQDLLKVIRADNAAESVQAPNITVETMQHAMIAVGTRISYVRDFTVQAVQGAFIADPILDSIFDGLQVEAICSRLRDGTVGIQMKVLDQKVERPIPELKTTIPGTTVPATLQLPRTTGCKASQTAALPSGSTSVMAARKNDGAWLVTLMTVHELR